MDQLKQIILEKFSKQLQLLDINPTYLTKEVLELKLNTLVENTIETIDLDSHLKVPLRETSNNNIVDDVFDNVDFGVEKTSDMELPSDKEFIKSNQNPQIKEATTIPQDLKLEYEMEQYAKSKYMQNPSQMFEEFKLHHTSRGTISKDWEAEWKLFVSRKNRYTNHVIKTAMDEDMVLNSSMENFALKYMDKEDLQTEFLKFKNHYLSTGDLKVSWNKVWENWCMNHKKFNKTPVFKEQTSQAAQKAAYKWDFKKAKDTSDRIKNWLEFEKGINWMEEFYLKDIPIPGIGWQEVQHPDFNKEEILLYKLQSDNGQFLVQHKTNEILDAEILEND